MSVYDERINRLRQAMKEKHIDYYLIPTADDHASEYVGDYYKVRNYYAGFTGSAGTIVIGQAFAGLWTDGRYFIQAEEQLKGSGVRLFPMGKEGVPTVEDYIREHMPEGGVLAYDGRVVDSAWGARMEKLLAKKQAVIRWEDDLAGQLWTKRPAPASRPVYALSMEQCGKSRKEKMADLRAKMQEKDCDHALLSSLDDIAWLLNLRGDDVKHTPVFLAFILADEKTVRLYGAPTAFSPELKKELAADGVIVRPYNAVYEDVEALDEGALLLDAGRTNDALFRRIRKTVRVNKADVSDFIPKAVKNETEINNLRRIHIEDGAAVTRFIYWLKTHVGKERITEASAAACLDGMRRQIRGYKDVSFDTISAYKSNAAMMHYSADPENCAELKAEGMLLVDSGGQYAEGTTDITRTIVLGKISDTIRRHYTLTVKSMFNLASARFLYGCTGYSLDILARGPLWDMGLDYRCGTGHGVGYMLSVHEGPNAFRWKQTRGSKAAVLEAGMVTTDEPGVYVEGSHGIRIENELLCRAGEKNEYGQFMYFEPLTWAPIDLDGIDTRWLNGEDIRRLNDYHRKVYEKLAPYMDDAPKAWLKEATRPIDG